MLPLFSARLILTVSDVVFSDTRAVFAAAAFVLDLQGELELVRTALRDLADGGGEHRDESHDER